MKKGLIFSMLILSALIIACLKLSNDVISCKDNPDGCPMGMVCVLTEEKTFIEQIFPPKNDFKKVSKSRCYHCPKIITTTDGFTFELSEDLNGAINSNTIPATQSLINDSLLRAEWYVTPRLWRKGSYGSAFGFTIEIKPTSEEKIFLDFETMAPMLLKMKGLESFEIYDMICVDLVPSDEFFNACAQMGQKSIRNLCKTIVCPQIITKLENAYLEIDFVGLDPFFWKELSVHFDLVSDDEVLTKFELNAGFKKFKFGPILKEGSLEIRINKVVKSPSYVSALPFDDCFELLPGSKQAVHKVDISF